MILGEKNVMQAIGYDINQYIKFGLNLLFALKLE